MDAILKNTRKTHAFTEKPGPVFTRTLFSLLLLLHERVILINAPGTDIEIPVSKSELLFLAYSLKESCCSGPIDGRIWQKHKEHVVFEAQQCLQLSTLPACPKPPDAPQQASHSTTSDHGRCLFRFCWVVSVPSTRSVAFRESSYASIGRCKGCPS